MSLHLSGEINLFPERHISLPMARVPHVDWEGHNHRAVRLSIRLHEIACVLAHCNQRMIVWNPHVPDVERCTFPMDAWRGASEEAHASRRLYRSGLVQAGYSACSLSARLVSISI